MKLYQGVSAMEIAVFIISLLVVGSQIPGNPHILVR
jgi:hypothetical protein